MFFLDEIHRMSRPAAEMLYLAMEDFRVDVVVGKGPGATAIPLEIPRFTLVGATTRAGLLPGPLRDRFGFTAQLDFYDTPALEHIVHRSAELISADLDPDGAAEIARRSRGTPRIANRLLRRVRDYAQVRSDGHITQTLAQAALELYEVDEIGLDRLDRAVLEAMCRRFGGGPGGPVHPRHLGGGGAGDRRGGRRTLPRPPGLPDADAAWPGRHARRVGAPGAARPGPGRRCRHRPRPVWLRPLRGPDWVRYVGRRGSAAPPRATTRPVRTSQCLPPTDAGAMGNYSTLVMIALMVGAFYLLILRPQKKRQQAIQRTLSSLGPGDRVLLGSGVFGTIVTLGDRQAVLEIAPGVEMTVLKQAIVRAATEADEDGPADEYEDDIDDDLVVEPGATAGDVDHTRSSDHAGSSLYDAPAADGTTPSAGADPKRLS